MGIDAKMFVRTKLPMDAQTVKRLSYQIAASFGVDRFWICKNGSNDFPSHGALELINVYQQDGPSFFPEKGETFIEVHLATRYYNEGYARGDVNFILAVAKWLECKIPGCEVWYGGDSSGVLATWLNEEEKQRLWTVFCEDENSYMSGFNSEGHNYTCSFCDAPMLINMWGNYGKQIGGYCPGCDERIRVNLETKEELRFKNEKEFKKWATAQKPEGENDENKKES